jgi:endonuclease/exonuclease/phosphatase family metal-dependent hydrolase
MKTKRFAFASLATSAFISFLIIASFAATPARAAKLQPPPKPAATDPDVLTDRLCAESADPDAAPDKIHIHCRLESGEFAPVPSPTAAPPKQALIVAYNMERGMKLDKQIELLKNNPDFADPDVMLISESDRGCSRTDYKNVTRDLAKALGMNYVYGVEYIELARKAKLATDNNETMCEHGNAVLSKYPISGADQIRHKIAQNWYMPPGPGRENNQPRLGGVMAVIADIAFPGSTLRVYAVHLDSVLNGGDEMRRSEALEIAENAEDIAGPVVVGGDMNTIFYLNDIQTGGKKDSAPQVFFNAGFKDAHSALTSKKRSTTIMQFGTRLVIDLIMVRSAQVAESGVCPPKICDPLSDHLPVWTKLILK